MRRLLIALAALALATPAAARVDATFRPDGVAVTDDGKPVLFYRTAPASGAEPGRANYVHPLHAPDGTVLTEDRPADHLHQRGVFWAWHQMRLDGRPMADGWFMTGFTPSIRETKFRGDPDGGATLTVTFDWLFNGGPELVYAAREVTRLRIAPLAEGGRRLDFTTTLTPRVDGLSLGGSDDVKGYGGFSVRLVRPDQLTFASDGKAVAARSEAVAAGRAMGFTWPNSAGFSAWAVGLACKADGRPITLWILRRELSMQNCVYPGRVPVTLRKGQPLVLESALVIQPRPAPR